MKKKLYPSMMCADFTKLSDEVNNLNNSGITGYHMDIMDGNFVPNMALGVEDYQAIRSLTKLPMDVHMMVQNPKNYVDLFHQLGANKIYIHVEADQIPSATLKKINDLGMVPGIAINPGTSVTQIEPLLPIVKSILVMTVNPGFAGQKYLEYVNPKIKELISLKEKFNFDISVDGAISPEKIKQLSKWGVDGFILGTSSLFGKNKNYKSIIEDLNNL